MKEDKSDGQTKVVQSMAYSAVLANLIFSSDIRHCLICQFARNNIKVQRRRDALAKERRDASETNIQR